jgi:adenylate cyclase class 2
MKYEVELKFISDDSVGVRQICESLAGAPPEVRTEVDTYLRHPSRSFAATDEALRVRESNGQIKVTYKGPKVDPTTKTRKEIEIEVAPASSSIDELLDLWRCIGFLPVRTVRKTREIFHIPWLGRSVVVSLDKVEQLGKYVEIELLSEPAQLEESRQVVKNLAARLGLQTPERRSYLELLLENEAMSADKAEKKEDWSE